MRQLDTGEPGVAGWGTGPLGRDPATAPFTIDLDSTICETYGLAKEGARDQRLHWPARLLTRLLAVAAGTGDVLQWPGCGRVGARHAARGAAHFLRETVGRVR